MLSECISILSEGKQMRVPFRDSKLTRMLSNALGGNSKTCLICAMSPASSNRSESLSTIHFAARAKKIVNHLHRNCQRDQTGLVAAYEAEMARLKEQLQMSSSYSFCVLSDQGTSCKPYSNEMIAEAGTDLSGELSQRLDQFRERVDEAQMLANKFVANGGTCILLSPNVACENGNKTDLNFVVRASCSMDGHHNMVQPPGFMSSREKWLSEEDFDKWLEWLRKHSASGTLASVTEEESNTCYSPWTPTRLGAFPGPVPPVMLDCFKRL